MTNTTSTPSGFNQTEYNALIHAIWRLDRDIAEETDSEVMRILNRDRKALRELFVRLG
jgi:hypothetical protein